MKIMGIDTYPIKMKPVKRDYQANQLASIPGTSTVIVRINTDKGISGLGEVAAGSAYFNQTMGSVMDWLRGYGGALVGRNPLDVIGAHRVMEQISGAYPPGCQPARAGIDLALYDIAGKAHNCPVYEILGGVYRTEFELLTNLYELTPASKAAACREFVRKGFRGLKVKVGATTRTQGISAETFKYEQAKLVAALEAVPRDIYIDADANQSWGNAKIAVRIIEEILQKKFYPNLSLEQPIHHLDFEGHRFIREALKIPVIMDESVVSPQAMLQIVKHAAADRIVLKWNRVGGLWQARKIIDICEAAWIGVSLDTMPFTRLGDTANCHLAATIRDPYPVDADGHLWFADTPFRGGLQIKRGRARINAAPGFGVELDEKKLEAMMITPAEWR
jgi:L-alanine-DL-glutamate epimerase-like enolase superfamily enzyme